LKWKCRCRWASRPGAPRVPCERFGFGAWTN